MHTNMNCAQANTGSMSWNRRKFTRVQTTRATGPWGPRKGERFDNGRHFSGIIGMDPGTCERKMSFGGDKWTQHDIYSFMGSSCDITPIRLMFHNQQGEYSRHCRWPNLENCLFRVLWYERCEDADIWLWQPADEN